MFDAGLDGGEFVIGGCPLGGTKDAPGHGLPDCRSCFGGNLGFLAVAQKSALAV